MDLEFAPFENEKSDGHSYDITDSYYSLYISPPDFGFPRESIGFVIYCPNIDAEGGAIKVFNIDKSTFGQGYLSNTSALRKRFSHFKTMIAKEGFRLVWEGKIYGFNKGHSNFESGWTT